VSAAAVASAIAGGLNDGKPTCGAAQVQAAKLGSHCRFNFCS
jgi:hypothetical protein